MTTDRQAALRTLIEHQTDEHILAAVLDGMGSYQAMIDETVEGMREAFQPEAAEDCVIGYEIATPDGDVPLRIAIHDKTATIEQRPPDDARVVLGLSLPDYLRLINGLLDGTEAFMQGRMKLRGDVMFAPQIERIFQRG